MPPIDLPQNIDDGDFEFAKLPPGRYKLQVETAEEKQSKAGNPMVKLILKTISTADGAQTVKALNKDEQVPVEGLKIHDHLVVKADAKGCMDHIQKFRKAFGLVGKPLEVNNLSGLTGVAELRYEESNDGSGKSFLRVAGYVG